MTWSPLLISHRREAALAAARDIARDLIDPPSAWAPPGADDNYIHINNAGLGFGKAGIALFLGYLARTDPQAADLADEAARLAADAARTVATERMAPSLFAGFCGIGWALLKLQKWDVAGIDEASLESIDQAVLTYLEHDPWPWHLDVVNGLAGVAVYALDRLPAAPAQEALERIVGHFEAVAEESAAGITWFTPPSLLHEEELERGPRGYYNLGMAHGVPGHISILADLAAAGVATDRTSRLLDGAVKWLLGQTTDDANFPYVVGPKAESKPSRVAWCYGLPGISAALWKAGHAVGREEWCRTALEMTRGALERPSEDMGVVDAAFCHGTGGIAHLLHRLYRWSGEEGMAEAARTWIDRTLEWRREGVGLGGYRSHHPNPNAELPYYDSPGMLTGAAGIGATLTAAASELPPEWDHMFLLGDPTTA